MTGNVLIKNRTPSSDVPYLFGLPKQKQRFCAVQAFCAAKPWRRVNSLRPSILISHRNPKKEVTTYVVTSFLERATRLARGVITPRHAQWATNAPLGRFLASLMPCSPLCPLEPKNRRFCAVQAFCAAKPWRRANSLRPSILISCRNPKNRRFCAVQAFCAAKPWRRVNSLRPSILISCRNPKKRSQHML